MADAKSTVTKYRIQTLDDFLQVPDDELDQCLKEFGDYLRDMRDIQVACHGRARWLLRDLPEAAKDEALGGMVICTVKRFMYRSSRPKASPDDSSCDDRLLAHDAKINLRATTKK